MALRVIGAGVGRTGTKSLKLALEELLGVPCYHMFELVRRPGDTAAWQAAVDGEPVDWDALLSTFTAAVDWPACAFWPELREAFPEAVIVLSLRDSPEQWWESMEKTIVQTLSEPVPPDDPEWVRRRAMVLEMLETRFDPRWRERDAAIAAYRRNAAEVREAVPAERLVEWHPGDGWEPLCAALDLPVPDQPFPHVNRAADFHSTEDLDPDGEPR
jgi:hypothetical protein